MPDHEDNLAQAERHAREGADQIQELKAWITDLERDGDSVAAAQFRQLLRTMEKIQRVTIWHLCIEREAHAKSNPATH